MKDFPFWHDAIQTAKAPDVLKGVGEDLAKYQNQSDFLSEQPKLNPAQLAQLRKMYAEKLKKLKAETF